MTTFQVQKIYDILSERFPGVTTFLNHRNPFELLIATVLSAQCTDARVNQVTPQLFEKFPTPEAFADSTPDEIVESMRSISFCYAKATYLYELSVRLILYYNSRVPQQLEDLVTLSGVGRKTANVVLGQAFGQPGITVDTHVRRLAQRLGWTTSSDPEKIEKDLSQLWPITFWTNFSSILILHGRATCLARKPKCLECELAPYCPSFT